ncbi:MAG TPA: erythromycin esterase family protein, partial [Vicinamibacterales bacterium]|nr:erythromycin esterase family protein [Vicinamibacterales bacterium]
GVPVAFEVARTLRLPLDVFLVRKLGVPFHPELAMGAIAEGHVRVLNEHIIADARILPSTVEQIVAREQVELERRTRLYRRGRVLRSLKGWTVILVDDGLATGATMEAAVRALRQLTDGRIVVAAPVGAADTCQRLRRIADEVVCSYIPEAFSAVGLWYAEFDQTSDEEVRTLLDLMAATPSPKAGNPGVRPRTGSGAQYEAVEVVRAHAWVLGGDPAQYQPLIDGVRDARVVLLGEATHGTHEFYRERAFITRRLIAECGFTAVAVEADWPDAYRVNRYVRGVGRDEDAVDALKDFGRFPTWMWRNADVLDFIGWLKTYNDGKVESRRVGFYGLDLYSLRASAEAVLAYLKKVDPEAASRARARYGCFDRFGDEMQQYGYAAAFGLKPSCEREVVAQLMDLHHRRADYVSRDGRVAPDDFFFAEQNARLVRNAEAYYRTMFRGHVESWNLRDRHMADTIGELLAFLDHRQPESRIVIWAHNSHLGDARATQMGDLGELNVGQLMRQKFGTSAALVGFTTHTGTVTAASEWDGAAHRKHVRPSLSGSYERLLHDARAGRFLLNLRGDSELAAALEGPRLERAIGVLYLPETERQSHYVQARLPRQFDYLLHFDETRAVEPLERTALWESGELAETYPSGL